MYIYTYQCIHVTFEVSDSMFEVSGPKSGWYDHYYHHQQNQWTSSTEYTCTNIYLGTGQNLRPQEISRTIRFGRV